MKGFNKAFDAQVEELMHAETGTDEQRVTADAVVKMYEAKSDRWDKIAKNAISIGTGIAGLCVYSYWMYKGYTFEETGSIGRRTERHQDMIQRFIK